MGNRIFTPKTNIDSIYVNKLEKYMEEDKEGLSEVKNIGLLGGYATGKSSILETLENRNKDKYTFIRFSSAVFLNKYDKKKEISKQGNNENDDIVGNKKEDIKKEDKVTKGEASIQKIIILQLLEKLNEDSNNYYVNDDFNLKKRFNTLIDKNILFVLLLVSIFTTLLFFINFIKPINSMDIIYFLLASFIISIILVFFPNYKISKIKMGIFEIENNNNNNNYNEIVTKEADLILEMLKEIDKKEPSKSIIVIIEDIDRYENSAIFDIFYNISEILKYTNVKIKFIYAVNPSMFNGFATKFFDCIIDVQSFYDKYTSGENFIYALKKIEKTYSWDEIFLRNLSFFIPDYRDMLRILNLFEDYDNLYNVEQKEMSLSIATVKSLYPNNLLLKCADKEDILEELLELLKDYSYEEGIEFKNTIKMINTILEDDTIKTETVKNIEIKMKKIKSLNNKLYELATLCIESGYLTNDYWWFISSISNKFTYNDNLFLSNYMSKTGEFFSIKDLKLDDASEIVSSYIIKSDYLDKKELLNFSLLEYLLEGENYEKEFNDLLSNFLTLRNIDSYNIKDKINLISFNLNFLKINESNIKKVLSNIDSFSTVKGEGFKLFLLIEKIIEFEIYDDEVVEKILNENIRELEKFDQEYFNQEGILIEDFLNLLKEYGIKIDKEDWLENKIILDNNLFEINDKNIEKVYEIEKNHNKLFDYLYENIDEFFKTKNIDIKLEFLKEKQTEIIIEDKELYTKNLLKDELNILIKNQLLSDEIKNKIIDGFDRVIEVNSNWKIENINHAILSNKKFYYEYLKEYKNDVPQEIENLQIIIDHLLKYPFSKNEEPNLNGEIRYLKGLKEKNKEILMYILTKLGEEKITFEEYKSILVNNKGIVDDNFINNSIYNEKFDFMYKIEEGKRVPIPKYLKDEESKQIFKNYFSKDYGYGKKYITKKITKFKENDNLDFLNDLV